VLPMYMGVTGKDPNYDFLISTNIETLSGDEIMPTCDEIKQARAGG